MDVVDQVNLVQTVFPAKTSKLPMADQVLKDQLVFRVFQDCQERTVSMEPMEKTESVVQKVHKELEVSQERKENKVRPVLKDHAVLMDDQVNLEHQVKESNLPWFL